jgi:F0F1-type ATP synthase assembly protein I
LICKKTTHDIQVNIKQMGLAAAIIISAFFGVLLYYIADRRGYNKQFWLIMGILFGPLSLPFIFLGKRKASYEKETDSGKNRD